MATHRSSRHALPPGVAELLPEDGADDIIEMWNLRAMNASGAVTPADVKVFVSTLVDMLPQHSAKPCCSALPGRGVLADEDRELAVRRCESALSRVVAQQEGVRELAELRDLDELIQCVETVDSATASSAFTRAYEPSAELRGKRHIMAFLVASNMLGQTRGDVRVSTSPRLTEGIGESGLVLVRAVVAERDVVAEPVPVKPPGHVYTVSRSDIFPIARILIPSKFASILVEKYCENEGYFSRPASAVSAPPAKKSARKGKNATAAAPARKKTKLDQYVVFDLPVDPRSADQCSVCTYDLKDEGMLDEGSEPRTLSALMDCSHTFHGKCLDQLMAQSADFIRCPYCKKIYGTMVGTQPKGGKMENRVENWTLPGFPAGTPTISIRYSIKDGVQGQEHPNPGRPYHCQGFPRVAYLPDNAEGRKALRLLQRAFNQRLTFTVGTSSTTGASDSVIWNDIHHKTQNHPGGEHGFPDANYFTNLFGELEAQGIHE